MSTTEATLQQPDLAAADPQDATTPTPAAPAAPQAPAGNGLAIASFVLGIVSVLSSWTFIAPIVGLILGVLALRRNAQERTLALWGVWMNAALLALTVIALLILGVVFGVAVFSGFLG